MARRASTAWWIENYGKPCIGEDIVRVEWYPGLGQTIKTRNQINVHDGTQRLWQALGAIMVAYNYKMPTSYVGAYACRFKTGGKTWSGHAWPLAMDVNAKTNPFIRTPSRRKIRWGKDTDMPAAMIREIELITASGVRAFDWGGRWRSVKDAMHFQIRVSLAEIAGDIYAPRGFYIGEDDMAFLSDDAQKFFQKTFDELDKLEPKTNPTWGRVLVEDNRNPDPGGKHTHDATTTIGESK